MSRHHQPTGTHTYHDTNGEPVAVIDAYTDFTGHAYQSWYRNGFVHEACGLHRTKAEAARAVFSHRAEYGFKGNELASLVATAFGLTQ